MPKMKRLSDSRAALALGTWIVYTLAIIPLYRLAGPLVLAMATIPVIVTGWLFGTWAGVLASLLALPLNMLLLILTGEASWGVMIRALPGSAILVLVGAVVGRLRDLGEQVKRELTERKRAEEALRVSEERFALAVRGSDAGLWDWDILNNSLYWSPRLKELLGYADDELDVDFDTFESHLHPDDREHTGAAMEAHLKDRGLYDVEQRLRTKSGEYRWFRARGQALWDEAGNPVRMVGSITDITERRRVEEALRRRTYDLGERVKELNCLYGISEVVEKPDISSEELIRGIVDLIPPVWQYPEVTCARIILEGEELRTENFRETTWKQSSDIVVHGQRVGTLEVCYLEERPESDEGPFLKEERNLLNAIAERLGRITERKRAEEALQESEERYRTLVENQGEGIGFVDPEENFTFANPAAHVIFGVPPGGLIGRTLGEFVDAETLALIQAQTETRRMREKSVYELELHRPDGERRNMLVTATPRLDNEGQFIGTFGVFRDITERKRAEEQLQRYAAELEQANEEVKQFAYIVSHDLRAPLVNLKGFAAELRLGLEVIDSAMETALPHLDEKQRQDVIMALEEDVPEALGFINSSATHMDHFISALLKLSRLGRRELRLEPVDMDALVQATLESLAHQIEERQVEVTVGPLPEVVADRTSMQQIMGNLLGNAVKYLDPDRPGRIGIIAQRGPGETTFHIRDNGRGIAEDDMDKVFAPFRRIGRQDVPGEGMGLPYVQALVRRHGGRIWCESEPGVGTTFTFTISNLLAKGEDND